jgi:acetyltransferase
MKNRNNLKKLFKPSSIAIVGASETKGKIGNIIVKNILELGYQGEVFFVNPKYKSLFGEKCYASLNEIENDVDLAIISIPAKFVNETVKNSAKKIKNFVVISAGFSETGKEGAKEENELLKIAEKNNLNVLGPNCLGFISPSIKLNASFAGGMPEEGGVSFVSQSGALAVAIADIAKKENIKFSQLVSVGNKMQLNESNFIEYAGQDENTKMIAMYLEGVENGREFVRIAKKVSKKKPIVILKAGKSEKAQKAIQSHTGSLAGSDKIMNAAFEKAGVIRAESLDEFFALIKIISNFDVSTNNQSAIITNAGGPGVLATDNFQDKFISLANLSNETREKLEDFLPAEASTGNPIDLLGDADELRYKKALEALENEKIGNIICIITAQDQTPTERIAQLLIDFQKKSKKNIIPVFIGGTKMKKALRLLEKNNLPNFSSPKKAIDALDFFFMWNERKEDNFVDKESDSLEGEEDKKIVSQILDSVKKNKRKALLFGEAGEVMRRYSIPVVDFINLSPKEKIHTKMDFPVVLKVDSDKVLHKTDKEALVLGIKNMDELESAIERIRKNFSTENLIVQPMVDFEIQLILGLKKDPVFGPILVYGLGGIYTEVFKMVDFLLLPATREEIRKHLEKSNISFLFEKTRGKKIVEIEKMVDVFYNFSKLSRDQEEIREIDINPLLISKKGEIVAVDIKIML